MTHFRSGLVCLILYGIFTAYSFDETILKIGEYLAKL